MSQGANPWSDLGCEAALKPLGQYLVRAVNDASDFEARDQMMYAATLAGFAFGNSGVHVAHGMSVIVNAPTVFRFTACARPEHHIPGAACLGADAQGAANENADDIIAGQLINMTQATGIPNGVDGVGYFDADVADLTKGAWAQQRLMTNAPRAISEGDLSQLYRDAMHYW